VGTGALARPVERSSAGLRWRYTGPIGNFIKLASQSDLPALNQAKEFPCGDKLICVANVNGEIHAMENTCLHRGGPLGQGVVEGGKVICPWHGWAWNPKTGEAGPPGAKVAVYPVKIEGGDVLIEL
jgi:nitrite reductase (NADH) small subunit